MVLNIPPKVRGSLYILTALGTPFIAYLQLKGIIGILEVSLWSAEVAVVSAMAAFNTSSNTSNK